MFCNPLKVLLKCESLNSELNLKSKIKKNSIEFIIFAIIAFLSIFLIILLNIDSLKDNKILNYKLPMTLKFNSSNTLGNFILEVFSVLSIMLFLKFNYKIKYNKLNNTLFSSFTGFFILFFYFFSSPNYKFSKRYREALKILNSIGIEKEESHFVKRINPFLSILLMFRLFLRSVSYFLFFVTLFLKNIKHFSSIFFFNRNFLAYFYFSNLF